MWSYDRRLELLVLKEEFFPQLNSLKCSIQILTEAARELLGCEELHIVLRLVLRAGNYMNTGWLRWPCRRLPDGISPQAGRHQGNKPGMDLLHFVAMGSLWLLPQEAERKDKSLLDFPSKLEHVGPASRIQEQEVASELQGLGQRLAGARGSLLELGTEQLEPFRGRFRTAVQVPRTPLCPPNPRTPRVPHAFGGRFRTAVQVPRTPLCPPNPRTPRVPHAFRGSFRTGVQVPRTPLGPPNPRTPRVPHAFGGRFRTAVQVPRTPLAPRTPVPLECRTPSGGASGLPCRYPEPPWAPRTPVPLECRTPSGGASGLPGASPKGCSPDVSPSRRFPSLSHKKGPHKGAEEQAGPISPRASPKGVSTLVGFFWRLSLAEKPLGSSQS
ncbi:unnamed protein product [Caretta caretta]